MKKIRFLFLCLGTLFASETITAQLKIYNFEQTEKLQQIEKRNIIVFIHTDWCKFCQMMKTKTFKNEKVIKQLNESFYYMELNAEEKRTIIFNKAVFKFTPSGNNVGLHQLVSALGTIDKQIAYPTLCVLNDNNEIIFQYSGFLNATDFNSIFKKLN